MRSIQWKIVINNNQLVIMEQASGFPQDEIESHLTIIGMLENLKDKHQQKLKTLYNKTVKLKDGRPISDDARGEASAEPDDE